MTTTTKAPRIDRDELRALAKAAWIRIAHEVRASTDDEDEMNDRLWEAVDADLTAETRHDVARTIMLDPRSIETFAEVIAFR